MEDDQAQLLEDQEDIGISRSIQAHDKDPVPDDPLNLTNQDGIPDPIKSTSAPKSRTEDDGEENKPPKPMTLSQKLTFAGIACMYTFSLMSYSVLAPFFPNEAEKKGVTQTETGLVFGIFALVGFISSPILGKYLPVIGAKFMYLSGCFVAAGCNILFGFLVDIEGKTLFLSYCFAIRIVESIGFAAATTAGMSITANAFPDRVAQMGGTLELFSGLGLAIGPPLGSLLYRIGGYKLPFILIGGVSMVLSLVNILILPSSLSQSETEKPGSVLSVLKIPAVLVVLVACMFNNVCWGFMDPTLSLHLTSPPLNVDPSTVGVLFLLIGGTYGISSPIWGYVADRKKRTRIMMVLGFYITGISYMLIGPSPLLKLPSQLWIVITAIGLLGFSLGLFLMPAFLDLLLSAKWHGLPDDISTQSVVSGLFGGAYQLGAFLGPTLGGIMVNQLGFKWSSTILGGCCFFVMIVLCLFGVWEYQCGKGRRKPGFVECIPYRASTVEDTKQVERA